MNIEKIFEKSIKDSWFGLIYTMKISEHHQACGGGTLSVMIREEE